jgi:hypothetical protein
MGYLEVVIPPDILSEESSEDGVALEGSNLQMKCKATGLPDPTVVWRREDSKNIILRADGSRDKQSKTLKFVLLLLEIYKVLYKLRYEPVIYQFLQATQHKTEDVRGVGRRFGRECMGCMNNQVNALS